MILAIFLNLIGAVAFTIGGIVLSRGYYYNAGWRDGNASGTRIAQGEAAKRIIQIKRAAWMSGRRFEIEQQVNNEPEH